MKKFNNYQIFVYTFFSLILFLSTLYVYNVYKDYSKIQKSEFLGNTDFVIKKIKDGKSPFSFAFISDTENNDASIWLIKNLLKEDINFLVFSGDIANDPEEKEHKLLIQTISSFNPKMPIFFLPGNHDVNFKKDKQGFSKEDFRNLYGPINFHFIYNDCLFVFISNIDPNDAEGANYLDKVLSERGKDVKYTFLFTHSPLAKLRNKAFLSPECVTVLDTIVEKYKIDYIVCGDYHRHFELTEDDGTRYIISGSGGAHFHSNSLLGRFKSGTKITVYKNCVTEELLVYSKIFAFTDNSLRHFIYKKIIPSIEKQPGVFNLIFSLIIINLLFSLYCVIKNIKI
jgi:UDP-2,3-diacylglucosamine pyrophosphatase LpxH